MNLELHSTGASFVAAKEDHNPRDFVLSVIRKMPDGTRKEQFEEFRALLTDSSDEYQRAVDWYFFVNMHDYITTNRSRRSDPVERAQARTTRSEMIESFKAKIVMLDLTMTNGKLLGDCTGPELRKISSRFNKLADRVQNKPVRSVLTEDQVKTILR